MWDEIQPWKDMSYLEILKEHVIKGITFDYMVQRKQIRLRDESYLEVSS